MTKKHTLLLGAHMSIEGGLAKSLERASSIGCTTMQIFTKSNRQWSAKALTSTEIDDFVRATKIYKIFPLVAHATYLINLGSPNNELATKSTAAVAQELKRCEQLGIDYLVLHPGSHLGSDEKECLARIAQNLDIALESSPGKTMILLETMAGQGSGTCYKFEQIAEIINRCTHKKRIGVCLDTCHIFAAGYDLRTPEAYEKTWQEFDNIIGLKALKVIHVYDSKKPLGSRVDRHEDIGKGELGEESFRLLFNDPRFFDVPKILETPKGSLEDDKRNMDAIKSLLCAESKKLLAL